MQQAEYYNNLAISQSAIKDFRFKSPKRWKSIWVDKQIDLGKNEDSFIFGSLVDTLLFSPHLLGDRFYISNLTELPTGAIPKIVKNIYDTLLSDPNFQIETIQDVKTYDDPESPEIEYVITTDLSLVNRTVILNACNQEEWNGGWKDETRINKIIEKGSKYFNLLTDCGNRKVISSEMNLQAIDIVNILKNGKLKRYFNNSEEFTNIFQLELFSNFECDGVSTIAIKGALDILHIDNIRKTIRVVDFKTSHDAHNFIPSIKKFGYCDQLSFYTYLVETALSDSEFCENYNLDSTYKVLEPMNIVVDTEDKLPYVYEYSWDDIVISREGNSKLLFDLFQTQLHNQKIKKGWKETLCDIAWHFNNKLWEYPREYYENDKIKVNLLTT